MSNVLQALRTHFSDRSIVVERKTRKRRLKINGLNSIEAEIMQIVWQSGKTSVRDVHEELLEQGYVPYTTVMAAMNNLALKGVLKQNKNGRAYLYSAAISKTDMANEIVDTVIEKILGGSPVPVISHLLKLKTEAEVDELMRLKDSLSEQE